MVRMKVCDDHPFQRPSAHGAVKQLLPSGFDVVFADTGVNGGPAVAVFDQPQINMIQLERQRHPMPVHARCNLHGRAQCGFAFEDVIRCVCHAAVLAIQGRIATEVMLAFTREAPDIVTPAKAGVQSLDGFPLSRE